ncbi:MAG: sodium:proton antiporter, partial [Thermoguttaceae bacterium]
METGGPAKGSYRTVLAAIALVILAYAAAAVAGLPQKATAIVVDSAGSHREPEVVAPTAEPLSPPPKGMIVPFALLLGAIAVFPLAPGLSHWWEHNLHKFYVAGGLAAVTLLYYLLFHESQVEGHFPAKQFISANPGGMNAWTSLTVFANAILAEYVPFIVLLLSLYTISGGIRLEGDLKAHPLTNTGFLAIGSALASVVGTTGAAMLLIRPLLETNRERKHVQHTVIFFIFVVCNCGGLLLPTGDPPLFLGYLLGVPFLWTLVLWKEWLFVNVCLLVIYYLWDRFLCYPRETKRDIARDEAQVRPLRIVGLWPNAVLLLAVIATVGFLDPSKPLPGTSWHPWMYLREMIQLGLIALSLALGSRQVRLANHFTFGAIVEVAVLFFGIFICMQPPLQILQIGGTNLRLTEPWHYFWATGSLSSFLDNAPTYVVFFETARSVTASFGLEPTVAATGVYFPYLVAVSLGSVFMGANTYIGNGPNFMIKTIAEGSGVKMPSFFGYMVYSVG